MTYLGLLIAFKIAVTLIAVAGPLLLLPRAALAARAAAPIEAASWLRLYGVAMCALLVGYASAYWTMAAGAFPWGVVFMGIVSNAGACAILIATNAARHTPILTLVFSSIAAGLIAAALAPNLAMTRVW